MLVTKISATLIWLIDIKTQMLTKHRHFHTCWCSNFENYEEVIGFNNWGGGKSWLVATWGCPGEYFTVDCYLLPRCWCPWILKNGGFAVQICAIHLGAISTKRLLLSRWTARWCSGKTTQRQSCHSANEIFDINPDQLFKKLQIAVKNPSFKKYNI